MYASTTIFNGTDSYYFLSINAGSYSISLSSPFASKKCSSTADSGADNTDWFGYIYNATTGCNYTGTLASNYEVNKRALSLTWYRSDNLVSPITTDQVGENGFLYETGVNSGFQLAIGRIVAGVGSGGTTYDAVNFVANMGASVVYSNKNTNTVSWAISLYTNPVGTYSCSISLKENVDINNNYTISSTIIKFEIFVNTVNITKWRFVPGALTDEAVLIDNVDPHTVTYSSLAWTMKVEKAVDFTGKVYAVIPIAGEFNITLLGAITYSSGNNIKTAAGNYSF